METKFEVIWRFVVENWYWLAPAILSIAARLVPTKKNYDIFEMFFRVLDKAIPNNRKKVGPPLWILFSLISLSFFSPVSVTLAQTGTPYSGRSFRFIPNPASAILQQNGVVYYDQALAKFRAREAGVVKDLIGGVSGLTAGFIPVATGATTLGNSTVFFSGTKATFTPSATEAGINIGQLAGTPSGLTNGDVWYNSSYLAGNGGLFTRMQANGTVQLLSEGQNSVTTGVQLFAPAGIILTSTVGGSVINMSASTTDITYTGRNLFQPTATLSGLNVGSVASDPSSLSNGDLWYNSTTNYIGARLGGVTNRMLHVTGAPTANRVALFSTAAGLVTEDADLTFTGGNLLNATNATVTTALRNSALTNNRVVTVGASGLLTDDADLTFSGNLLTATHATVTTNLINTALTATRVPFIGAAGLFDDDLGMTYIDASNQILMTNSAVTHTTSVFGGEIQFDFPGGSDDVTLNNAGINISGGINYLITSDADLDLTAAGDDINITATDDINTTSTAVVMVLTGGVGAQYSYDDGFQLNTAATSGDGRIFVDDNFSIEPHGDNLGHYYIGQNVAGTTRSANLDINTVGTLAISAGTITYNSVSFRPLRGSATLDFPSMAVGDQQALNITVTGASTGDVVSLGTPGPPIGVIYTGYVSASNTVTVLANNAGTLTRDPASATFNAIVFK